jgi:small subunit ribosomal protein S18
MSDDTARQGSGAGAGFVRDKDMMAAGEGKMKGPKRRRKVSYLTLNKIETVDYKDVPVLRRFINDRGKILPSRQSGNTAKQQRMIARAIRRARELALLPFVVSEMSAERREFSPRRDRGDRGDRYDRGPRDHYQSSSQHAPAAASAPAPAPEAQAAPAPAPAAAPAAEATE